MNPTVVYEQLHGYRKGHELLSASVRLDGPDQDLVNRLSDLTGRLRPGELFDPYLTAYPLPSRAFYVVARTFQDLEARRSGCVLTRSLFVCMDAWVELKSVELLRPMLVGVQRGEEAVARSTAREVDRSLKPVADKRVVELVHALFFEDVRPVVVFDAPEAELIATRLLEALSPSLRSGFSLCTFALGPRRLGDRDFDLLFGPLAVRSRFSDGGFRRIGVRGSLLRSEFHRLAAPTATRMFVSEEPSLVAPNVLAIFDKHELSDRAGVRIVLRWEELAARAKTTPTAVLGMLDILNVRGGPGSEEWDRLLPFASAALDLARNRSRCGDSWAFLFALTAKVEWRTAPAALARKLEETVRCLARREPEEALGALSGLTASELPLVANLKGLGDGAGSSGFDALSADLGRLDPSVFLRLVVASERLGEALVAAMNKDVSSWLSSVVSMFEGADVDAGYAVRRRLLPLVSDAVAAETIPPMLGDVAGSELADLAVDLAGRGKFRSGRFLATFAEVVRNSDAAWVVRDAVAIRARSADVDAFLLRVLEFTRSDLEWLLKVRDGALAGRLLTALLADADTMAIHSLLSTRDRVVPVLSTLHSALPESALQIARLLTLDLVGGGAGLDFGFAVVAMLPTEERQSLETWLLRELLSAAPSGDERLAHALSEFSPGLRPAELVAAATAAPIPTQRVSGNLEALNTAPSDTRDGVVGVVDVLSRHLVERRREELDEASYRAWSALVGDSTDPERRIRAASMALGFALRRVSYPVSSLVVVSFPTIYRELLKLKKLGLGNDVLPGYSYWLSQKKPKGARRRLIDALVQAFLRSSWPPADLVIAALEANAEEQVLKRVRKRFSGFRYLRRIHKDARRLDDDLRRRVLACLTDLA